MSEAHEPEATAAAAETPPSDAAVNPAEAAAEPAVADTPAPESAAEAAEPAPSPEAAAAEELLSGASDKPAEPAAPPAATDVAPAEPAAPAYEWQPFTLPEDISEPLAEERLQSLREVMTAAELSPQDRAQKLLDLHVAEMRNWQQQTLQRQMRTFEETQRGWRDQFKGDPEVGGAGAQTSLQRANAAIRRFASEERRFGQVLPAAKNGGARETDHSAFMNALRVTGMINHPEMVRFLARVENMLREPAMAAPAIGPSAVPRDIGNRRPSTQAGNPGRGNGRVRDMYDHPRSGEVFNGGAR